MKVIHKEGKYLRKGRDGHEDSVPASDSATAKEDDHASSSHHQPGGKPSFMEEIHKEGKEYLRREGVNKRLKQTKKQQQNKKKLVYWVLVFHCYPPISHNKRWEIGV